MTRENAIKILEEIIDEGWLISDFEKCTAIDALEMAIKALEQEPILNKIRAEIEREIIPRNSDQYDYEAKWQNSGLRMALKVIDKYKVESEDE